jgi:hypothetical protein
MLAGLLGQVWRGGKVQSAIALALDNGSVHSSENFMED